MENKKIKLLLFITGLNLGGAESIVRDLAINVDHGDFDPIIISILSNCALKEEILKNGVKLYELSNNKKNNFFVLLFKLIKIIKKEKPDIIHTHLFHADILGRIAGKITGVKVIISTIHNVSFGGKFRELLLSFTKWMLDGEVAVASLVYDDALKKDLINKKKTEIIYNNVNSKFFLIERDDAIILKKKKDLDFEAGDFIFLSVGRLVKQKGYFYMLDAIKKLILENKINKVRFLIISDGYLRKDIEKYIEKESLGNVVFLLGYHLDTVPFLKIADAFIMPSLWEGCSVALNEAAAAGLPIITTSVGAVNEFFENDINSIIIPPANSIEIEKAIEKIILMPKEKKKKMAMNARKLALDKFSINKMVSSYEKYYKKFIK